MIHRLSAAWSAFLNPSRQREHLTNADVDGAWILKAIRQEKRRRGER